MSIHRDVKMLPAENGIVVKWDEPIPPTDPLAHVSFEDKVRLFEFKGKDITAVAKEAVEFMMEKAGNKPEEKEEEGSKHTL